MPAEVTVFIDCTDTINTGRNTGVQRVVRNIVQRARTGVPAAGLELVPVVAANGSFYRVGTDISGKLLWTELAAKVIAGCRNLLNALFASRHSAGDWPVDVLEAKPERNDLHGRLVRLGRKFISTVFMCSYRLDGIIEGSAVTFSSNDVLFLPDVYYKPGLLRALGNLRESDVILILLIYDMFPITHPASCESVVTVNAANTLATLLEKLSGVISISRSSLADVERYLSPRKQGLLFDYFYLGADFTAKGKLAGNMRDEVVSAFSSGPTYLAVGTVEPRKNYLYILEAFERIWADGNDTRLCIVGRVGWKSQEVLRKIKESPELDKRLFYFPDLNDDELAYCYARSKAVLFSSLNEGFGLPLVEAMHFGKPVFVSDIPVFREIGREYPIYVDLEDSASLARAIATFETGVMERRFTPQKWRSWDESIDDLWKKLLVMVGEISRRRTN